MGSGLAFVPTNKLGIVLEQSVKALRSGQECVTRHVITKNALFQTPFQQSAFPPSLTLARPVSVSRLPAPRLGRICGYDNIHHVAGIHQMLKNNDNDLSSKFKGFFLLCRVLVQLDQL